MGNAELENKIALVTGGSNGIGLETVKLLANKGATVIVGYYNGKERAKDIINSLPNKNHMIHQIKLEDHKTAEGVAEVINQSFGKLDILVNSAGFTKPIPHKDLSSLDIELFDKIAPVLGLEFDEEEPPLLNKLWTFASNVGTLSCPKSSSGIALEEAFVEVELL